MLRFGKNDVEVSFFPCSRNMDCEFEYGIPNEGLGSFVHSLLPDSLHIDPSTVSPSPSPLLTQKTIWAFDYRASYDNHLEEIQSEDEEYAEEENERHSEILGELTEYIAIEKSVRTPVFLQLRLQSIRTRHPLFPYRKANPMRRMIPSPCALQQAVQSCHRH